MRRLFDQSVDACAHSILQDPSDPAWPQHLRKLSPMIAPIVAHRAVMMELSAKFGTPYNKFRQRLEGADGLSEATRIVHQLGPRWVADAYDATDGDSLDDLGDQARDSLKFLGGLKLVLLALQEQGINPSRDRFCELLTDQFARDDAALSMLTHFAHFAKQRPASRGQSPSQCDVGAAYERARACTSLVDLWAAYVDLMADACLIDASGFETIPDLM